MQSLLVEGSSIYAKRWELCTPAHRLYRCVQQSGGQASRPWLRHLQVTGVLLPDPPAPMQSGCPNPELTSFPCPRSTDAVATHGSSSACAPALSHADGKPEDYPGAEKLFVTDASRRLRPATGKQTSLSRGFPEEGMGDLLTRMQALVPFWCVPVAIGAVACGSAFSESTQLPATAIYQ